MHCHRLNHEDNGLMALINVIPAISSYAVAVPGAPGKAARGARPMTATATGCSRPSPRFPAMKAASAWPWATSTTMACTICSSAPARITLPKSWSIQARPGTEKVPSRPELARFRPFAAEARGGISVAAAQIDGTSADNIIVGSGPGIPSEVRVYSSKLPSSPGTAPALFATFSPYAGDRSGVSLATGFVDFATGRLQHRHRAGARGPGRGEGVRLFAAQADQQPRRPRRRPRRRACGRAEPAGQHRLVQAVRRRLPRRRFARDRLARRIARRRQTDRRQPACRTPAR